MSDHDETPRVVVRPHPTDPLGVRVDAITDQRPVYLEYGDGSKRDKIRRPGRKPAQHSYAEAGSYRITALSADDEVIAAQHVVVRASLELDGITVGDDDGAIRIAFGDAVDDGTGVLPYYRIEWPDGDIETVWGVPGRHVRHEVMPGQHHVRMVDTTTGRVSWYDVTVDGEPYADPDFDVRPSRDDETGMTVLLRITSVDQDRPVHIWWDDADGPQVVENPTSGMEIEHRYIHPGHYLQIAAYSKSLNFASSKSESMTVPARTAPGEQLNHEYGEDPAGEEPSHVRASEHDAANGGSASDTGESRHSVPGPAGDLLTHSTDMPADTDSGDQGGSAQHPAIGDPTKHGDTPIPGDGDTHNHVPVGPMVHSEQG